jgi:hypothetical protein
MIFSAPIARPASKSGVQIMERTPTARQASLLTRSSRSASSQSSTCALVTHRPEQAARARQAQTDVRAQRSAGRAVDHIVAVGQLDDGTLGTGRV